MPGACEDRTKALSTSSTTGRADLNHHHRSGPYSSLLLDPFRVCISGFVPTIMKPQMLEEEEDDLQAEEENKLINEVRVVHRPPMVPGLSSTFPAGIQDMVRVLYDVCAIPPLTNCTFRKKNAPYLYDVVITHALDWPTLTCQWFPDKES